MTLETITLSVPDRPIARHLSAGNNFAMLALRPPIRRGETGVVTFITVLRGPHVTPSAYCLITAGCLSVPRIPIGGMRHSHTVTPHAESLIPRLVTLGAHVASL